MVTQYDIEKKVTDYVTDTGRRPRFVLLDSATYKAFSQSFAPKEKIEFMVENPLVSKLVSIHLSADISLQILEVNMPTHLFEVAG
jgi:hypothetical protein